jgi:bifunctional UDP-N-acetylglucosamine pyrophosphorylase/glucosamine-1-phosphate N-acetyltransferase
VVAAGVGAEGPLGLEGDAQLGLGGQRPRRAVLADLGGHERPGRQRVVAAGVGAGVGGVVATASSGSEDDDGGGQGEGSEGGESAHDWWDVVAGLDGSPGPDGGGIAAGGGRATTWGMTARSLSALVLAAGHGTRMRSTRPKPLHLLVGRPLVRHVLDALEDCHVDRAVVVVGHGADVVTKKLQEDMGKFPLEFVEQHYQRGTGDAVAVGLTGLPDEDIDDAEDGDVLVLPGDTPLLRSETLAALVAEHRLSGAACTVLTAVMEDPSGYGRIVRDKEDRVRRIVEHRDADDEERAIDEINTGIFVFRRGLLAPALRRLTPDNSQGELYITDVVEVLADAGHQVVATVASDPDETRGVNDRAQLAEAEAELRRRINERWMHLGVTIVDPEATYIDADVVLATDVTLWPGTVLRGETYIERGAEIGPATDLVDSRVGEGAYVFRSVALQADIGENAIVGPFASLGPGDQIAPGRRTGPFYAAGDV